MGTRSKDVEGLEKFQEDEKHEIVEGGQKLRDELEEGGVTDRYEKRQGPRPNVDDTLIGARVEQLWNFTEKDGTVVPTWCRGKVVAVKKANKVHIKWDEQCLSEGDLPVTEERFLKTKWNKHVEEAWRWNLDFD